jgi:hypothetical protein
MIGRLFRNLEGRSLAELRERATQALSARLERLGFDPGTGIGTGEARLWHALRDEVRSECSNIEQWWATRWRLRRGGFVPASTDWRALVEVLNQVDPGLPDEIVRQARCLMEGRFDLLGYRALELGFPPEWHTEPVSGKRSPSKHWSTIDYLEPAVTGDHKAIWELNRHQWMVTLGQAYVLTGDDRFAIAAVEALQSWMDANHPKYGINWVSSLEISYRSIAWLWLLRLIRDSEALSHAIEKRAIEFLLLNGNHIRRYLSTYFSPNTHLTGEALGLYYLGNELADFEVARDWRDTGRAILLQQLPRHVRADGTYVEQATWYHRYTLDIYSHFLILAQATNDELENRTADVRDAVERLAIFLLAIMRPDGSYPLIGDDDGGRVLFLDLRRGWDARSALATAAALTGRADLGWASRGAAGEAAWLLGKDVVETLPDQRSSVPTFTSRAFPHGGIYVMRSDWSSRANIMVVDAGPHGFLNGGHAHADALSFDVTVGGIPVLVDPGTASYSDAEVRDRFRATASHNAVTLNGESSSRMAGPFSWRTTASATVRYWLSTADADYLEAEHDGYGSHPWKATVKRRITYLKPDTWIVIDSVSATSPVEFAVHLHCGADCTATTKGPWISIARGAGSVCGASFVSHDSISVELGWGEVSPEYGARTSAPAIRCFLPGVRTATVWTVIVDLQSCSEPPTVLLHEQGVLEIQRPSFTGFVRCSAHGLDLAQVAGVRFPAGVICARKIGTAVEPLVILPNVEKT